MALVGAAQPLQMAAQAAHLARIPEQREVQREAHRPVAVAAHRHRMELAAQAGPVVWTAQMLRLPATGLVAAGAVGTLLQL